MSRADLSFYRATHPWFTGIVPDGCIWLWIAATRDLEQGEFIAEYCGEIISNKEMKQRGLAKTSEYLFNVGGGLTIDASRFGNVTRYMNHSTNANVRPMVCNHCKFPSPRDPRGCNACVRVTSRGCNARRV